MLTFAYNSDKIRSIFHLLTKCAIYNNLYEDPMLHFYTLNDYYTLNAVSNYINRKCCSEGDCQAKQSILKGMHYGRKTAA